MGNIIQFPPKKEENRKKVLDHEMDMTRLIMEQLVTTLNEYRYDSTRDDMMNDMGLILNMVYAMLRRHDGLHHKLQPYMDEMIKLILEMKKEDGHNES